MQISMAFHNANLHFFPRTTDKLSTFFALQVTLIVSFWHQLWLKRKECQNNIDTLSDR